MGGYIRALRVQRRFTQNSTAKAAGVTQPYMSQVESDRATLNEDQLQKVGGLLGVPSSLLIRLYPKDGRSGIQRGSMDDSADERAARALAEVYRCASCGTRPTTDEARALVDALAELRGLAAIAPNVLDPEEQAGLWRGVQERLDVIAALIDVSDGQI